ncbi:MAG: tRNA lysidine(34) synthetase TilS [Cyclobacteriaceae bacterium]|nr:tRNA lysidine(34) synthetase TilS [Cyclobacteriaceae bacterium]MCH8514740.1 tRNA lysidine(34) synthetase TilS [Cyclobacteriaceae bacterium]
MLKELKDFLTTQGVSTEKRFLLAVSGGLDSMVMASLFHEMGVSFAVAHCNFRLRAAASDGDADFVASWCKGRNVPLFSKSFDTMVHAEERGISIQMAARELRYQWFEELMPDFDFLCTAHHSSDLVESILQALINGRGADGLLGIHTLSGQLLRPLLFASREQIAAYAASIDLQWREDASNQSTKYQRNYLRHRVVPALRELQPSLEDAFGRSREKLSAMLLFAEQEADAWCELHTIREADGSVLIPRKKIKEKGQGGVFLLEHCLKKYGFHHQQVIDLLAARSTGAGVRAGQFIAQIDRDNIRLSRLQEGDIVAKELDLEKSGLKISDYYFEWDVVTQKPDWKKIAPNEAYFPLERLAEPLFFRVWQQGDRMQVLGSNHRKKVSDLLIDNKVPLAKKKRVVVLQSGDEIIWIPTIRSSERVKVLHTDHKLLRIRWRLDYANDKT